MHASIPAASHVPGVLLGSRPSAAPMLRLSGNGAPERERLVMLRDFFERLGVRYDSEPTGNDPIEIDLTLQGIPGLQLLSARMQGARFRRTRESTDPTEDVGLLMNGKGAHFVAQRGREIVLGDGDATLISLTEPLETMHRAPGDIFVLRFPRPELAPRLAAPQDCIMRRIPHGTEALGLLSHYINITWRHDTWTQRELQQVLVAHFYDLIAVAIGATRDAAELAQGGGLRVARLHAIKQDIARNLARRDLSVAQLARRHGCTPRVIQRLLGSEGTSFTEYLLTQRLARAHRMLTDPYRAGEKISMIAFDAGFADLSYFNRTFRRRYGVTPSDIRAAVHQA
jgi:AraC-like DNA-binding protein